MSYGIANVRPELRLIEADVAARLEAGKTTDPSLVAAAAPPGTRR
jgi:hypothetical protein